MMTQENMIARYRILHELGRGAMGAVYAARDRETGGVVALKRLDPALLSQSDADFAERFLKHARSARLLKHPNIVRIHEAGEAAGTVYVAMEMLEGQNLRSILDDGPLPIARAIRIAHDIASGLAYAHLEGVVHGGVKPSNVVVLRSGVVKITDFGIGQAALLSGARAGGLSYMPPEQLRGDPVDHRCDIFALGALFYEMLTHRPPFEGDAPTQIMENMLHAKPPLPSELNPHVPRALDAIVLSMLAAQPVVRMPGVPILLRDLQRLEEGLGLRSGASAATDEPSVPPAAPEPRLHHKERVMRERETWPERSSGARPAMFATLALLLAALGIGVAGYMYYSSDPSLRGLAASRMQEAPATAPGAPQASLTRTVGDGQAKEEPLAAEPGPLAQRESLDARASEQPASAGAARAQELPRATQPAAKAPEREPRGTARLILAVAPRGEIYIDGKHHGTTPPITTLDLEPGMYRIEVRSGSRKPYLTYITVQTGDVRRIRHDFNASGAVPPA